MSGSAITPADVRVGVAREIRALAGVGVTGPEAHRRALAIVAGKIRNSPALAERQAHAGRCHQCNEALDDTRAVVAVLGGAGRLWLHGGECHDAFGRRRAALVERIMWAAGYGATVEGEAA